MESPIHHFGGAIHTWRVLSIILAELSIFLAELSIIFMVLSTIGGGGYPSLLTSRYKKGEINGFIYRK
ncbi:hypothetical protein [Lysinibacillus xylanilyticus]|uniref:hypothetical protein n=1 Tax=Lysinibacillus xylanilyticus TaxID=582475 RepID=UPI003D0923B8